MIRNFKQFITESEDRDFKISDFFASLTRSYESEKLFYTDRIQFEILEERKSWGDLRAKAELEQTRTENVTYKLSCRMDDKTYNVELDFSISYLGKKEKDTPDLIQDDSLNVVLEKLNITKIVIKNFGYKSSSPSDIVRTSCYRFLIKLLKPDYDVLGKDLSSIEM